jgi:hypothetical protein
MACDMPTNLHTALESFGNLVPESRQTNHILPLLSTTYSTTPVTAPPRYNLGQYVSYTQAVHMSRQYADGAPESNNTTH